MEVGVLRVGELTEQSLADAIADEKARGLRPGLLAVGSPVLERRARAILSSPGGMSDLRVAFPLVTLDPVLASGQWQVRAMPAMGSGAEKP